MSSPLVSLVKQTYSSQADMSNEAGRLEGRGRQTGGVEAGRLEGTGRQTGGDRQADRRGQAGR